MKAITKAIQYFLVFGSLLLLCMGCGNSSPAGIQPQMDPVVLSESTGASGSQFIPLGSPVFIASQTSPIQPENYWIAWRDPELGYVAAAKSGVPVTVRDPAADSFSTNLSRLGRQAVFDLNLSTNVFQPADTTAVLRVSSSANVPPPPPPPPSDCEERPRVVCDDCGICVRLPPIPCPTPTPEPTPEPEPITCELCEPNTWADPNYRSFDGLLSFTDFEGDFILARTLNGQVEIQARQKRVEGPGDSQNTGIAIRNGSDVVEFSVVLGVTTPGLIVVNGQQVDVKDTSLLLDSGLQITYTPGSNSSQGTLPNFVVRTSTGDTFRVETFIGSLGMSSQIVSQGNYEGILGDANGDPSNDWTPLGGSSLETENYLIEDYGNFIESWRVVGDDSQFNAPFGTYTVSFTDWWYNSLSPEELRAGFELYEQLFGNIGDPYFAFRFAVDLAGGIPVEELTGLYDQVRLANIIDPIPPQDADLNQDGIPDGEEAQPFDFGNLLNDNNQNNSYIDDASRDYTFNPLTNFIFSPVLNIEKVGDDFIVLTASGGSGIGFTDEALPGLYVVRGNTQVEPLYVGEANQRGFFTGMAATSNGVFLLIRAGDRKSSSLLWVKFDGSPPETLLATPGRLGAITSDGTLAYLFESLVSKYERIDRFIKVSSLGTTEVLSNNPSRDIRFFRTYGSNQFLVGSGTGFIDIVNQLGEYVDTFINPHIWVNGGSIRPSGDFRESTNNPGTVTLLASDSDGSLFPNGAFVEQTPGRKPKILLKFPGNLRPEYTTLPNFTPEEPQFSYARSFVQAEQDFIFDICAFNGFFEVIENYGCQLYIASPNP